MMSLNEENLVKSEQRFLEVMRFNILDEAKWFVRVIGPIIESKRDWISIDLQHRYESLLAKNRFVIFGSLNDNTVISLVEHFLGVALESADDLDLQSRLELKLLSIPIEDRDEFKKKLRDALSRNDTDMVTKKPIIIQGRQLPPSVRSWILDYNVQVGAHHMDVVKRGEYFTNSQNIRPLSEQEKRRVMYLLDFYDGLTLSSLTPEGLEDPFMTSLNGRLVTFVRGQFEPVEQVADKLIPKIPEMAKIQNRWPSTQPAQLDDKSISANIPFVAPADVSPAAIPPKVEAKPLTQPLSPKMASAPTPSRITPTPAAPSAASAVSLPRPPEKPKPAQPSIIPPRLLIKELSAPSPGELSPAAKAITPTPKQPISPSVEIIDNKVEELTQKVLREVSLPNLDSEQRARLGNAVRLRLREIRDTVDTRDVLVKKRAEGGVELSDQTVDEIIAVVMKYLPEAHRPFNGFVTAVAKDDDTVRDILAEELTQKTVVKEKKSLFEVGKVVTPAPAPAPITPPVVSPPPSFSAPPPPAPPVVKVPQAFPEKDQKVQVQEGAVKPVEQARKPTMVDVRAKPSVIGPIDELRLFTVADFRRLDSDPKKAAARVHEKIKLLEEESYLKMVEGLRAWRQSPLNQLYLVLGRESLQARKNLADAIRERREAGKAALSEDEFGALLELNKQLRF